MTSHALRVEEELALDTLLTDLREGTVTGR
jgi:hypothetical protein